MYVHTSTLTIQNSEIRILQNNTFFARAVLAPKGAKSKTFQKNQEITKWEVQIMSQIIMAPEDLPAHKITRQNQLTKSLGEINRGPTTPKQRTTRALQKSVKKGNEILQRVKK